MALPDTIPVSDLGVPVVRTGTALSGGRVIEVVTPINDTAVPAAVAAAQAEIAAFKAATDARLDQIARDSLNAALSNSLIFRS